MQPVSVEGGQTNTLRDPESPICIGALELPGGQGLLVLRLDRLTPTKTSSITWLNHGNHLPLAGTAQESDGFLRSNSSASSRS